MQFNDRFQGLNQRDRIERYMRLADSALQNYDLRDVTPTFIQHNGGVSYRLDGRNGQPLYLLKIAQPVGESGAIPPENITLVMQWLAAIAGESDIVVQEPIANQWEKLVTAVDFVDLNEPFHVTVQHWIEGEHVREEFTCEQVYRIGALMARLHEHSNSWTPRQRGHGVEQDEVWLAESVAQLRRVVDVGILTQSEWRTVELAMDRLAEIMRALGKGQDHWGAIHCDLHHENLLFHGDSVRPIDFHEFCVGHFPFDLGVTLYHIMYLYDVERRRALRDGYRSVRALPDASPQWAEAFLCAAAMSNLAFQVTIPGELASDHCARNIKEFANSFCSDLASEKPFVFD